MLTASEAIQQVEYTTNAIGQPVIQLSLPAWEIIRSVIDDTEEDEEDPLMLRLFLDFITAQALEKGELQPYTTEMSMAAHSLIDGVQLDDE